MQLQKDELIEEMAIRGFNQEMLCELVEFTNGLLEQTLEQFEQSRISIKKGMKDNLNGLVVNTSMHDKRMLSALSKYIDGVLIQILKRASRDGISLEQATKIEIEELRIFLFLAKNKRKNNSESHKLKEPIENLKKWGVFVSEDSNEYNSLKEKEEDPSSFFGGSSDVSSKKEILRALERFTFRMIEQVLKKVEKENIPIEKAMESVTGGLNIYLAENSDKYHDELRKTYDVEESMKKIIEWGRS